MKSNKNITFSCKYHIVWTPKYRKSLLVSPIDIDLKDLIRDICERRKVELIEVEVMPDHVHLLIDVDPQYGVHKIIKEIKGLSSRLLRNKYPNLKTKVPTLWSNSYFISTVGSVSLDTVKAYIENQKTV